MRHSIATMALSGALPEKLAAAAQAGFDAVEIFENDLLACRLTPREIRHMAADLGLGLDIYQPLRDFEGVDPAQFQRNLQRAERKFDLMQELGIGLLLVCSNAQPTALGDPDLIAGQLEELANRAAKRNLRVGFEALSWGTHTNRFAQAYAAVVRADHRSLGLVLDSYHTLAEKRYSSCNCPMLLGIPLNLRCTRAPCVVFRGWASSTWWVLSTPYCKPVLTGRCHWRFSATSTAQRRRN